jgi:hypothetical protein
MIEWKVMKKQLGILAPQERMLKLDSLIQLCGTVQWLHFQHTLWAHSLIVANQ